MVVKKDMVKEAIKMASTRGHASPKDIEILVDILRKLGSVPVVIQLGAGSGTMTLAILGAKPRANLTSVDVSQESLQWEQVALDNCDFKGTRTAVIGKSKKAGFKYKGRPVDLLLIDADHSFRGVLGDLLAWRAHLKKGAYIFVHDYTALYPEVAKACGIFFGRPPLIKDGWSAVWRWQDD